LSLTGNLEDLPLLDILQIVSFSKKTGFLTIAASEGEGAIVFSEGLVVSSFTWESLPVDPRAATLPPERRATLIKQRIAMALERLIRLREGEFNFSLTEDIPRTIGDRDISLEVLAQGINPQEMLLDLARGLDEDRRDSSAALEASFAEPSPDDLLEEPFAEPVDDVVSSLLERAADERVDAPGFSAPSVTQAFEPVHSELEPGAEPGAERDAGPEPSPVAPDSLELEPEAGAEDQDEEPAEPQLPPEPESEPEPEPAPALGRGPQSPSPSGRVAAATPVAPPEAPPRTVLLVDDEDDVRGIIAGLFSMVGYDVVEAEDPDSAVRAAGKLGKAGTRFLLLTDVGMPASGGASFQGGFEVVKRLWKMNLHPPVLMMTESLSPALQARARQMGVSNFVFKPGLSKLDRKQFEADLRAFATRLVQDVLPSIGRRPEAPRRPRGSRGPGAPVRPPAPAPSAEDLTRELTLLQERLAELRRQGDPTQISLMVMRVAREFFERGVLLLAKNEELRGLGGFGLAPKEQKIGLVIRDVTIPLKEPSVFREVVDSQHTFVGELPDSKWTKALMARIGKFKSGTVVLVPLLTNRETIALLYGDNPETGRMPGRLETLELFINQAGIALENAFLQRKLKTS
jgi:CheY-like chemotaxis protein